MIPQALDGHGGRGASLTIDSCSPCTLFWFDTMESVRLSPRAVLDLFRFIGAAGSTRNTLRSDPACVRCRRRLAYTHDVARTTRFTYWRCADGHGKLITFHQFLAEKQFVRPPSPAELARLRETVRQVSCSQCGAPIDLREDSACTHCGTPVTLIDPPSVQKALRELSEGARAPAANAEDVGRRLSDAQIEALFALERARSRSLQDERHDLVSVGAAAIAGLIGGWLSA
jgi:hypothetical protein